MSDVMTPNSRQGAAREVGRRNAPAGDHKSLQKREDAPVRKKARRGPIVVGLIVLVLVVAAGLYFGRSWLLDTLTYVSTDDAFIDANHVNISAKMLGRINSVLVTEGSKVQPGRSW